MKEDYLKDGAVGFIVLANKLFDWNSKVFLSSDKVIKAAILSTVMHDEVSINDYPNFIKPFPKKVENSFNIICQWVREDCLESFSTDGYDFK